MFIETKEERLDAHEDDMKRGWEISILTCERKEVGGLNKVLMFASCSPKLCDPW